jgi:hypothetical protein
MILRIPINSSNVSETILTYKVMTVNCLCKKASVEVKARVDKAPEPNPLHQLGLTTLFMEERNYHYYTLKNIAP